MKLNMRLIKIVFAIVLIFATIAWALGSLLPTSYSGSNLNFGIGSGPVTVTNPSDASIPVMLVAPRTRSFSVANTAEGASGSSTRQGTGGNSTNNFTFDLLPGINEFTITRGTDVTFEADTATQLQARVTPLDADSVRTSIIVALVVVLGSLFYISRLVDHAWIRALRPQKSSVRDTPTIAVPDVDEVNRGRDGRMYSDT